MQLESDELEEDDIFGGLKHHRDFLAAGFGNDVGVEHFIQHRHTRRRMACFTCWCRCWSLCISFYSTCKNVSYAPYDIPHSVICSLNLYGKDTCTVLEGAHAAWPNSVR